MVNANGLALLGIQFNYQTPYNMGSNLTLQYQITPTIGFNGGYVGTNARHLEVFPNTTNSISTIAYYNTSTSSLIPYPTLGRNPSYAATEGNSNYNGLLVTIEKRFANGLNFLGTYTYSKVLSDAHDLLNGGSVGFGTNAVNGYRAPAVPGYGIHADYGLASFDIRNVFHFSGGYQLPFGKGQHYMSDATGVKNQIVGGWSLNWLMTFQGGQPIALSLSVNHSGRFGLWRSFCTRPAFEARAAYRFEWQAELVRKSRSLQSALSDRIKWTTYPQFADTDACR